MTAETNRLPRFRRVDDPRPIRLTKRDIAIVRAVARLRFAASTHICALVGGSEQQVLRRLQLHFHHGLLDRPRAQLAQLAIDGNSPMVYGLGRKGAQLLSALGGPDLGRLDWHTKNGRAGALFIKHTLLTADIVTSFIVDIQGQEELLLLDHEELLPYLPAETRAARNPFLWNAQVRVSGKLERIGLVPDRLMSLYLSDDTRINFAIEADTGQMPVRRRTFKGTSIARKVAAYAAGYRAGEHTKRYGFQRLRVLFVTATRSRVATMIEATRDVTEGSMPGMFLFTDRNTLIRQGALAPIWQDIRGNTIALIA